MAISRFLIDWMDCKLQRQQQITERTQGCEETDVRLCVSLGGLVQFVRLCERRLCRKCVCRGAPLSVRTLLKSLYACACVCFSVSVWLRVCVCVFFFYFAHLQQHNATASRFLLDGHLCG